MKSNLKIQNILMKGIAIVIVLAFVFSAIATLQVVYADELDIGQTDDNGEGNGVDNESNTHMINDNTHNTFVLDANALENIIIRLAGENYYTNFKRKVSSSEENDIIYLSTEADLRCLSLYVAQGNSCQRKNFKLKNNINLTDTIEWNPIGDEENPFSGNLDGAGYTISGILISIKQNYSGFIGYLKNGTIKNLNISNSNINLVPEVDNKYINDLIAADDVGYNYLGSIVGYSIDGKISNCINNTSIYGGNIVGGIVGSAINTNVEYCRNSGKVTGYRTVGGISGQVYSSKNRRINLEANNQDGNAEFKVYKCYNNGEITAITSNAGGIAGTLWNEGQILSCQNSGNVSVYENVLNVCVNGVDTTFLCRNAGGIVGWVSGDTKVVSGTTQSLPSIMHCTNTENTVIKGYQTIGGIVGRLGGSCVEGAKSVAIMAYCDNYSNNIFQTNTNTKYYGYLVGYAGYHANNNTYSNPIISKCYYPGSTAGKDGRYTKVTGSISAIGAKDPNVDVGYFRQIGESYLASGNGPIDDVVPQVQDVMIKSLGNSKKFAVKGDKLEITIKYHEKINIARIQPILTIKNYIHGDTNGYFDLGRQAKYMGINDEGDSLVYEYELQGNEDSNSTLFLIGIISDTFDKKHEYLDSGTGNLSEVTDLTGNGQIIIRPQVNDDEINVTSNINDNISALYTVTGFKRGVDNNLYINKNDQLKVVVNFSDIATKDLDNNEAGIDLFKFAYQYFDEEVNNYMGNTLSNGVTTEKETIDGKTQITFTVEAESLSSRIKYLDKVGIYSEDIYIGGAHFEPLNSSALIERIYIDTEKPNLSASVSVNSENPNNRYTTGEDVLIKLTSSEELNSEDIPKLNVYFGDDIGKYNSGNAKYIGYDTDDNGIVTYKYRYTIQDGDDGTMSLKYANNVTISDVAENTTTYNAGDSTGSNLNIIADTIAPTVTISAKNRVNETTTQEIINNTTNADRLLYIFEWSEEVNGFSENNITVNNGKIKVFEKIPNSNKYRVEVETLTPKGNTDELQVIVEQDAVHDLVGHGNVRQEQVITIDKKAPTVEITADKNIIGAGEEITYTFNWSEAVKNFDSNDITVTGGNKGELNKINDSKYTLKVFPPFGEDVILTVPENKCTDIAGNSNIGNTHTIAVKPTVAIAVCDPKWDFNEDGKVDLKDVKVYQERLAQYPGYSQEEKERIENNISSNGDIDKDGLIDNIKDVTYLKEILLGLKPSISISNQDNIIYTFTWSEEVTGFDINDITVNGGAKGTLSNEYNNNDGTYSYSMLVTPNVAAGNTGELQVIVEQDAVQDLEGNGNIRTESVIQIDKIAPILISLEAYGESNVNVDPNVDSVKQYYKAGDKIYVVATFSENIENSTIPKLKLQFSESGESASIDYINFSHKNGNKIIYTYTIVNGDSGTLSVKGFSGIVKDAAGNETVVTKRALDGDTIIVDTKKPYLVKYKVIAPMFNFSKFTDIESTKLDGETKRYGKNNIITIKAEFSENIYHLNNDTIEKITADTAPNLNVKFGGNNATGNVVFDNVTDNIITYKYLIPNEDISDNGEINVSFDANELNSAIIADNAGNRLAVSSSATQPHEYYEQSESENNKVNKIVADTTKPSYTITAEAVDKDDNGNTITGNGNYYKKGSVITITAETNEYIYKKYNHTFLKFEKDDENVPKPTIYFGNIEGNSQAIRCTNVEYVENKTRFTYEYVVQENDNCGNLKVEIAENSGYDIALNGNSNITQEFDNIITDTVKPYIATNTNSNSQFEINSTSTNLTATGIFSEKMYVLKDGVLSELNNADDAPKMGVFADGEFKGIASVNIETTNDGRTILAYTYNISNIDSPNISCHLISGTLYDRAGNQWSLDISNDTTSPIFEEIQVITESGHYNIDKELDFIVKFNEQTKLTLVPELKIKIGEKEISLTGTINENDELNTSIIKVARYKYKIVDENGPVTIVSLNGTASDGNRTREINEEFVGSSDKIKDHDGNQYINTESAKVIVDTTAPKCIVNAFRTESDVTYINPNWDFDENGIVEIDDALYIQKKTSEVDLEEKIESNINKYGDANGDKEINIIDASLIKQQLTNVISGTTNLDKIYYAISWSEPVNGFEADDINIINGIKGRFIPTIEGENKDKLYILEVDNANEGRQIIRISENVCEDTVGNINTSGAVYNGINIDYTKPEIRAKVNGGKYVIDTKTNKAKLKEILVVNEEVSKFKYAWSTESDINNIESNQWKSIRVDEITVNSDITLNTEVEDAETYYLYIKVTDKAGNVRNAKTKAFEVENSIIEFIGIPENITNKDVTVTVNYGDGLTENRRAGVQGKTQSADPTTVIVTETGKVYAEATDIAGNKVYAVSNEIKIASQEEPIDPEEDTTPPVITFDYTVTRTTLGNPIGATITTNEDAKISYSWDGENWTTSSGFVRSLNVTKPSDTIGVNTLYAKAVDRAQPGNESEVKTLEFIVEANGEQPEDPSELSIRVKSNGATINTYTSDDGSKYIIVSPTITVSTLKDNIEIINGERGKLTIEDTVRTDRLKTTSRVEYDGDEKYIVVVQGDVNCDGQVAFNDVLGANSIRGKEKNQSIPVWLAADINRDGTITFSEILAINAIRTK